MDYRLESGVRVTTENGRKFIIAKDFYAGGKFIAVYISREKLEWVGGIKHDATEIFQSEIVKIDSSLCVGDAWGYTVWEKHTRIPELEAGMIVVIKEGLDNHIVMENDGELYLANTGSESGEWIRLSEYSDALIHPNHYEFTIQSIWESSPDRGFFVGSKMLWERT